MCDATMDHGCVLIAHTKLVPAPLATGTGDCAGPASPGLGDGDEVSQQGRAVAKVPFPLSARSWPWRPCPSHAPGLPGGPARQEAQEESLCFTVTITGSPCTRETGGHQRQLCRLEGTWQCHKPGRGYYRHLAGRSPHPHRTVPHSKE